MKLENFSKLTYSILSANMAEKNNNVMIKNSWVLANLCANLQNFDKFTLEENQNILSMILSYCNSSKEKLVSNGYRALGYYISNNKDDCLVKVMNFESSKSQEIANSLKETYLKSFASLSVKVCWNVCVSFANILKNYKPGFMKIFYREETLDNMLTILTSKNNFKTYIHCVDMLTLAFDNFPDNKIFRELPKILCEIYFSAEEGKIDATELRYLPHLKSSVNNMIIKLLSGNNEQFFHVIAGEIMS